MSQTPASAEATKPAVPPRTVAVIDVGTTSTRMVIAQIGEQGEPQILESLSRDINLGRDSFTAGSIQKSTIEECVEALRHFQRVLREYQIERPEQILAVATSAVREASNRQAFLDRLYIGAGIAVEIADEAEVSRLTYLSIERFLRSEPSLTNGRSLAFEVGGGSTELLAFRDGRVVFSHTYRLGSFRLRQMLEAYKAPVTRRRSIMENHIRLILNQMKNDFSLERPLTVLALGGDARFAAAQILGRRPPNGLSSVKLPALAKLTDEVLGLSVDDLAIKYKLTFPAAETLGPALLTLTLAARAFEVGHLLVPDASMRDGLLREINAQSRWDELFEEQMVQSALDLGRKYHFDEAHGQQVAALCRLLYDALAAEHRLSANYRLILTLAALLHELGNFISFRSHHKHSMYLILNSELFGLGKEDMMMVALIARYHRRAQPSPEHEGYNLLSRENRIIVSKLAAILRVADALERSHSQRISSLRCRIERGVLLVEVPGVDDLSLEQMALQQKGGMFESVYGMPVRLRALPGKRV